MDLSGVPPSPAALAAVGGLYACIMAAGLWVGLPLLRTARREGLPLNAWTDRLAAGGLPPSQVLRVAGLWVLLQVLLPAMWAPLLGRSLLPAQRAMAALLYALIVQVAVLLAALRAFRAQGTWRDACSGVAPPHAGRALRDAGRWYLATMPVLLVAAVCWKLVLHAGGVPLQEQEAVALFRELPSGAARATFILVAVIGAPLVEEVLFRGVLLPVAVRAWGLSRGLFVVSLLFAVAHLHLPNLVPLLVIGMAFGLGYLARGTLLVPIAMHAVFNAVNLVALAVLQGLP